MEDVGGCRWPRTGRVLAATARCNLTTNPQLLLIVVFLHRSTRRHEWLYPLKLKIVPDLKAEQHSGNHCRVRRRIEVNPPDGRVSTKEEGGGALSGFGDVDARVLA
jgi:hypothetical protein